MQKLKQPAVQAASFGQIDRSRSPDTTRLDRLRGCITGQNVGPTQPMRAVASRMMQQSFQNPHFCSVFAQMLSTQFHCLTNVAYHLNIVNISKRGGDCLL